MSISKKHHYTPRYYLEQFENGQGAMWRMEHDSDDIVRGNSTHFGYKKHWNTLRNPPSGYAPDWAELRLSEVDGMASARIARILGG
jgi:Protein of unknown function (DUF4238)